MTRLTPKVQNKNLRNTFKQTDQQQTLMLRNGIVLQQQGKVLEAKTIYESLLKTNPNNSDALHLLGSIECQLKNYQNAADLLAKAIGINPCNAASYTNRGIALQKLKQLGAALVSYDTAISLKPGNANTYFNRGVVLKDLQKYDDALKSLDKAISLHPDFALAYNNHGIVLFKQEKFEKAIASFDKAIKINSKYAEAYCRRGLSLNRLQHSVESLASIRKAIEIDPNLANAKQVYATQLAFMSNYDEVCKLSDAALISANEDDLPLIWENRLYTYIYHPELTDQEICDEHIKWGDKFCKLGQEGFIEHDRTRIRRLRVGYVSPDFREHTCRFYFEPLFACHDQARVEMYAYSGVLREDKYTEHLKTYFNEWRNIVGVSDVAVAEIIRNDKIDILIDTCGHMSDTRLSVFAHKPAPIQVSWLGAVWTTGLKQIDYVLYDPYMAPKGTVASEKIVQLPRTWAAFRPGEKAKIAVVKATPAATNGYITFGYSGRSERLNSRVFNVWGRILKRLPDARLIIDYKAFFNPMTQAYYSVFLQEHGIDMQRVEMRNSQNIFEGLGDIDILLDSFPHSGGTMLFDAVWMGVPVLTLASSRPVGRIGTSLMTNLGLSAWVAQIEQEYEDKAVLYAQDIPALQSLRSSMRLKMQSSPLMDESSFAHDVENAYEKMWSIWLESSIINKNYK
jgi:protein O-GlcNAc transferase